MSDKRQESIARVSEEIEKEVADGMVLGLGSGSTVAGVLHELAPRMKTKGVRAWSVPTSMQIEIIAESEGFEMVPFRGSVDLVVDGADQVDERLNLIKGGGGALLKEKVLMKSSQKTVIVADEQKFVGRLCTNSVKVPVEVSPFARELVKRELARLGASAEERMLPKGYPYFTENGNIILDARFPPIENPREVEMEIDSLPGVVESGVFTIKPITVYKIMGDGGFERFSG